MRSIGVGVARTQFYRLLDEVAVGETVTITRRGAPVARLVPIDSTSSDVEAVLDRMREFRKGISLGGITIRELIDEGRR